MSVFPFLIFDKNVDIFFNWAAKVIHLIKSRRPLMHALYSADSSQTWEHRLLKCPDDSDAVHEGFTCIVKDALG